MTCEGYREQFNGALDTGTHEHPSGEMMEHARSCTGCREYTSSMLTLHSGLLSLPVEQPSRRLLRALSSIGASEGAAGVGLDWRPEIRRAFLLLIPLVLILLLRLFPAAWAAPAECCVVTAVLAWLFTNILRPAFFVRTGSRSANL